MQKVLDLLKNCDEKEIPVGAVVVKGGKIISQACNLKETLNDVTAHAEILAIREAEKKLGNWRLDGCDLYVNLEPCPMCATAIINSRISNVYFGSYDPKFGALGSIIDLRKIYNSPLKVYGGIMEKECDEILNKYFAFIRSKND